VHRKATLGRRKEGVRWRPVRGSAHGRVEGRPGRSANGDAYRGANDSCGGPGTSGSVCGGANGGGSVQGLGGAHDATSKGTHTGCKEEKVGRRVASDGARGNAYGGTNGGCSGQGADGTRGRASGGARAGCDEGRASRWRPRWCLRGCHRLRQHPRPAHRRRRQQPKGWRWPQPVRGE
jgi:hypothetical protein